MKTFFKFSGIIAFIIALVGFIIMLTTPGITYETEALGITLSSDISSTQAIFGKDSVDGALTGLFAFLLVIVALIILCLGVLLPILKVKALDKVSGVLNLVAVVCLVVAGILCFTVKSSYFSANDIEDVAKYYDLGIAFILGGILYIVAGVIAMAPAVANLISKK